MKKRLDITDEQIVNLYFMEGLNRRQTAEKLNCSQDLVRERILKMGLEMKPMSESVMSTKSNHVELKQDFIEILDGEMLGDGGLITKIQSTSFRESFGFDKKEWAEYIRNILVKNNLPVKEIFLRPPSGKSPNCSWGLSTNFIVELKEQHNRWYINNLNFDENKSRNFDNRRHIKIIPKNLILTKNALLHWYIGDGTVGNSGGCTICSQGFSWEEIEFLRYRMEKDFSILTSHHSNDTIYLPRFEKEKFLEIIGKCPVECYKYKWFVDINKKHGHSKFNPQIDMQTVEDFLKGAT